MNTVEENDMTAIQEGEEQAILTASKYLSGRGIESTITLAEDCRPGM